MIFFIQNIGEVPFSNTLFERRHPSCQTQKPSNLVVIRNVYCKHIYLPIVSIFSIHFLLLIQFNLGIQINLLVSNCLILFYFIFSHLFIKSNPTRAMMTKGAYTPPLGCFYIGRQPY